MQVGHPVVSSRALFGAQSAADDGEALRNSLQMGMQTSAMLAEAEHSTRMDAQYKARKAEIDALLDKTVCTTEEKEWTGADVLNLLDYLEHRLPHEVPTEAGMPMLMDNASTRYRIALCFPDESHQVAILDTVRALKRLKLVHNVDYFFNTNKISTELGRYVLGQRGLDRQA